MTDAVSNTMAGLLSAIRSGVADPVINRGKEWIYPDRPRSTLGNTKFPRISISHVGESTSYKGIGASDHRKRIVYDISVWAKKKGTVWVASVAYNGNTLISYLIDQITDNVLEDVTYRNYLLTNYGIHEIMPVSQRANEYMQERELFKGTILVEVESD